MNKKQFEKEFDEIAKWFLKNKKPITIKQFRKLGSSEFVEYFNDLHTDDQEQEFKNALKRVKK